MKVWNTDVTNYSKYKKYEKYGKPLQPKLKIIGDYTTYEKSFHRRQYQPRKNKKRLQDFNPQIGEYLEHAKYLQNRRKNRGQHFESFENPLVEKKHNGSSKQKHGNQDQRCELFENPFVEKDHNGSSKQNHGNQDQRCESFVDPFAEMNNHGSVQKKKQSSSKKKLVEQTRGASPEQDGEIYQYQKAIFEKIKEDQKRQPSQCYPQKKKSVEENKKDSADFKKKDPETTLIKKKQVKENQQVSVNLKKHDSKQQPTSIVNDQVDSAECKIKENEHKEKSENKWVKRVQYFTVGFKNRDPKPAKETSSKKNTKSSANSKNQDPEPSEKKTCKKNKIFSTYFKKQDPEEKSNKTPSTKNKHISPDLMNQDPKQQSNMKTLLENHHFPPYFLNKNREVLSFQRTPLRKTKSFPPYFWNQDPTFRPASTYGTPAEKTYHALGYNLNYKTYRKKFVDFKEEDDQQQKEPNKPTPTRKYPDFGKEDDSLHLFDHWFD